MSNTIMARTEFAAALNQIATERGISPEAILDSLKVALLAAYDKDFSQEAAKLTADGQLLEVTLDSETGEFRILAGPEGASRKEKKDVTPPGFGRIAAGVAKQVILQQVREAEKTSILSEYTGRIGELITGMILRVDGQFVYVDIGRGQGVMPPEEQIRGEFYRLNSRMAFLISDIRETFKGQSVIVSRSDPRLVSKLFEREVPEVSTGVVEIKGIAREAGVRTKIAVMSKQDGVDPVGSCVGQKGVRVQAVINELNGERVDIIQYSTDPVKYLAAALAPAENLGIEISKDGKIAHVTVPDDQLSLAIGRGGQNVKLAALLTNLQVKIEGASGQKTEAVTGKEEHEIDLLNLDPKVRTKLIEAGITMLEQILGENFDKLKEIKGIGPKSLEEIRTKLAAYQQNNK